MVMRLEVAFKPELFDAEGASVKAQARDYFGIEIDAVRVVNIVTFDTTLSDEQLESIRVTIFTNPVTQISSFESLDIPFD